MIPDEQVRTLQGSLSNLYVIVAIATVYEVENQVCFLYSLKHP